MRPAYIVDLDGTVADLSHRVQFYPHDHENFEAGIPDDLPIMAVIHIVRALWSAGFGIVCTTGRTERTRRASTEWLQRQQCPFDALYMRADGDHRADHIVKRQLLDGIRADGWEIVGVLDDRQSVVDMWREEGLVVLQNAPNPIASGYQTPDGLRPTLTVMVGPSGAGKSSWLASNRARNDFGIHGQHIIASDQVRLDLFGTIRRQDGNDHVFDAIKSAVKARLKHGLPAAIDATHIRDKGRREAAELACGVCPVRYIVIDRPMAAKQRDAGWRADVKFADGSDLITRHDHVFRSNIKNIMAGDGLPNVTVFDERTHEPGRMAAA